jgi:hypothetical protein
MDLDTARNILDSDPLERHDYASDAPGWRCRLCGGNDFYMPGHVGHENDCPHIGTQPPSTVRGIY